jgi:hypothetical protein
MTGDRRELQGRDREAAPRMPISSSVRDQREMNARERYPTAVSGIKRATRRPTESHRTWFRLISRRQDGQMPVGVVLRRLIRSTCVLICLISLTVVASSGDLSSRTLPTTRGNRNARPDPLSSSPQVCTGERVTWLARMLTTHLGSVHTSGVILAITRAGWRGTRMSSRRLRSLARIFHESPNQRPLPDA